MNPTDVASVQMDIAVADGDIPSRALQIHGGYRITADGTRVMQFRNEERIEWGEWEPEYFGELLAIELTNLFEALLAVRNGGGSRYEIEEVRLEASNMYYAFERLSGGNVRVAARYRPEESSDLTLVPAAERGFTVALDDLCREAADCGDAFVDAASAFDHDLDREPVPTIREYVDQLRSYD